MKLKEIIDSLIVGESVNLHYIEPYSKSVYNYLRNHFSGSECAHDGLLVLSSGLGNTINIVPDISEYWYLEKIALVEDGTYLNLEEADEYYHEEYYEFKTFFPEIDF